MLVEVSPSTKRSKIAHADDIGEMLAEPSGLRLVISATGVPT
jgi:hypothetical protein